MMWVASHAAPKPTTRTPNRRACVVIKGSSSNTFTKAKAAATETTNWNARTGRTYRRAGA